MESILSLDWPYAFGGPVTQGRLRSVPEDFLVEEDLGFLPEGQGEHLFVKVRKRGANTDFVARQLARLANLPPSAVSYAGLKDRHAVTTQWFSLHLPGRPEPDFEALPSDEFAILETARHSRKLRRGALRGNRFRLVVREPEGDPEAIESRLASIRERGVPNYFGEQRFGREGGNVARAVALFEGRLRERNQTRRGLYLSAARSALFNALLGLRVREGSWDQALPGECLMLDGKGSFFVASDIDETLRERLRLHDLHPSGPLWGRGEPPCRDQALEGELRALQPYELLRRGLEAERLDQERRPLRLVPRDLAWSLGGEGLTVEFFLPAGCYATTVLREVVAAVGAEPAEESGPQGAE